jgi:hypothetical protein
LLVTKQLVIVKHKWQNIKRDIKETAILTVSCRNHLEGWEIILECILRKYGGKLWTGLIWLRIGTSCGLL